MIGMSLDELKGAAKARTPQGNPVIDQALAAEGVTGRAADFVKSMFQQESSSGGNTKTSNAGAVGIGPILPSTFKSVASPGMDINNPLDNARASIRYALQGLKAANGDPQLAGAYYYGGPGGLQKAQAGVAVSDPRNPNAPNTLQYGQQVAARMAPVPTSALVSGVRGLAQGATAGWSDEAAGGGAVLGGAFNKVGMKPSALNAVPVIGTTLSALMILAGSKSKDESIADTYTRIRDSERKANADAQNANPGTYTASQLLGTLLPAYLIKNPTALGAVSGAGNSDATTAGGLVKDTATGAAFGGVAGLAGNVAGASVKKIGDKLGNDAIDRIINATGPTSGIVKNTLGGAAAGAGAGATGGATVAVSSGQFDKIPEYAANGALGGAALGATGALKTGMGGKIASAIYKRTDDANMGSALVNGAAGTAAKTAGSAVAANVGSSDVAKDASGDVLSWVKSVMGLDTPAGQQNAPQSFRDQQAADATAVKEGDKDGQPAPDVPNIVKEGGNEFLITPSGRRVQLN
jgi:hypothetical protein